MQTHVIETVLFQLKDGITASDFLKIAPASTDYIQGCKGFVTRRLSSTPDGQWVETVEWDTMENALAAAAGLPQAKGIGPFLAAIDEASVAIHHTEVQISLN